MFYFSYSVRQYSDETDHSSLIDVDYDEVVSGLQDNSIIFIDIREPQELEMMGKYHPAAIHIPSKILFSKTTVVTKYCLKYTISL